MTSTYENEMFMSSRSAREPTEDKHVETDAVIETKTTGIDALKPLFGTLRIHISGSIEDPLFGALGIATHIGDERGYAQAVEKFTLGEEVRELSLVGADGKARQIYILTEAGVYRYLMRAKGKRAGELQQFIFQRLKEERKRSADSIRLLLKITRAQLEEAQRENATLRKNRVSLYCAINGAREKSAELTREAAKLRKAKTRNKGCEEPPRDALIINRTARSEDIPIPARSAAGSVFEQTAFELTQKRTAMSY